MIKVFLKLYMVIPIFRLQNTSQIKIVPNIIGLHIFGVILTGYSIPCTFLYTGQCHLEKSVIKTV